MSTRATICIKEGRHKINLYHHHDGYPLGVGATLKEYLQSGNNRYHWYMFDIANALVKGKVHYAGSDEIDNEFEVTSGQHGDEEYAYLINCKKKTLTCYKIGWDDKEWTDDKIVPIP